MAATTTVIFIIAVININEMFINLSQSYCLCLHLRERHSSVTRPNNEQTAGLVVLGGKIRYTVYYCESLLLHCSRNNWGICLFQILHFNSKLGLNTATNPKERLKAEAET